MKVDPKDRKNPMNTTTKNPEAQPETRRGVYEMITERIVELLEQGTVPWRKSWNTGPGSSPRNLVTKRPYRGVNVFLLGAAPYGSPYWLTMRQVQEKKGRVRKGERSTPVVMQNAGEHISVVWPTNIQTRDPVFPLPKSSTYAS